MDFFPSCWDGDGWSYITFLPLFTFKGTQAWNFFKYFFTETESLWSQGPVTRDFWKSYSIQPRYSTFKHFRISSVRNKIISSYAQGAIKSFPRMLSIAVHVKAVNIFSLAENTWKFVRRMLNLRWNCFLVCSGRDKLFLCMLSMRKL